MRGDSLKERILRVATIEEVVAAYVPLQRSGAGYGGAAPVCFLREKPQYSLYRVPCGKNYTFRRFCLKFAHKGTRNKSPAAATAAGYCVLLHSYASVIRSSLALTG